MENGDSIGLSVLNVDEGDFKITFDKDKPGEYERAAVTIKDMLLRGYMIVVDLGNGEYKRIKRFDAKTSEYIVRDVPPEAPRKSRSERRLPADKTPAVAIARSARGCARSLW